MSNSREIIVHAGHARTPVRRRDPGRLDLAPPAIVAAAGGGSEFAWEEFFADEADPYADAVAQSLASGEAVVPSLWPLEVANALIMGERRKRSTEAQAAAFVARLRTLPIVIDDQTHAYAWVDTMSLARAQNLSAYDAAYLELALRRGLPLASLDSRLKTAAAAVGIPIYSAPGRE